MDTLQQAIKSSIQKINSYFSVLMEVGQYRQISARV